MFSVTSPFALRPSLFALRPSLFAYLISAHSPHIAPSLVSPPPMLATLPCVHVPKTRRGPSRSVCSPISPPGRWPRSRRTPRPACPPPLARCGPPRTTTSAGSPRDYLPWPVVRNRCQGRAHRLGVGRGLLIQLHPDRQHPGRSRQRQLCGHRHRQRRRYRFDLAGDRDRTWVLRPAGVIEVEFGVIDT